MNTTEAAADFYLPKPPKPALGPTQPPVQWSTEVKRPGREAEHSPSSSAEGKNPTQLLVTISLELVARTQNSESQWRLQVFMC